MTKRPPKVQPDLRANEEALRAAYEAMVLRHMQIGWHPEDIALGIEALAQEHIAQFGGRRAEEAIARARYEAHFDRQLNNQEPSAMDRLATVLGALIWSTVLFSLGFVACWGLLRFA